MSDPRTPSDLTKSDREMLKAIYRRTVGSPGTDEPIAHTGDLAEVLRSSPATATTHIKRLADRGPDTGRLLNIGAGFNESLNEWVHLNNATVAWWRTRHTWG